MNQPESEIQSTVPAAKQKIPVSLTVVSYIFFVVGLFAIIGNGAHIASPNYELSVRPFIWLIVGILYLQISRGLRRCSKSWHTYAVVALCYNIADYIYQSVRHFITLKSDPAHTSAYKFAIAAIIVLLILSWQLWVLTRPNVRRLFYKQS